MFGGYVSGKVEYGKWKNAMPEIKMEIIIFILGYLYTVL